MKYYNGYFFNKRTLQEGYYYYIDSKIKNVKQENSTVTAEIIGDKTYNVKLEFKENEVKNGNCTCTEDSHCKHMAALFHFLNEEKSEKELNCLKQKLKPIIKKINKEELEDYLLKLLSNDDELLYKFNLKFHTYFPHPSLENYKERIKAISACEGIEKSHNKKYYDKKEYYFDNMSKLLIEVKELIKEQEYDLSFDIVSYILDDAPKKSIEI